MHPRNLMFVIFASLAFATAACVGELEPNGPGDDDDDLVDPPPPSADAGIDPAVTPAEEQFDLSVKPILQRCSGEACHSGTAATPLKFLGSSGLPDDYYDSITQFPSVTGNYSPALANMILKIEQEEHNAMSYTAEERQAIIDWLNLENVERNDNDGDGEVDPPPVGDALAQWSGCMSIENWNASEMYRWADKNSNEGPCRTCHNDGAWRFNTNNNDDNMFEMNRYQLYIIGFFTVKVETDGTQTVIPAYDKITRMGDGSTLHPRFNTALDDNNYQRLEDFYNLTMQAKAAGTCGPPVYPDPL